MTTPEGQIKADIKAMLRRRGAYYVPVKQGSYGKTGDPDMVICYKGVFIAMEGKTSEGAQSGWQDTRMEQALKAGGIWIVGRDVPSVEQVLDEIDRRFPHGII